MKPLPLKLQQKLLQRNNAGALRQLPDESSKIDFYTNDYLNFAEKKEIQELTLKILKEYKLKSGATGSRLLSGNYYLYDDVEKQIANFHNVEKALIFNSGYNANIGFFSCVPQRGDVVFYDELIHASIRDGLQMSLAKCYKFKHNDFFNLRDKAERILENFNGEVYVVTESVFSMDGDSPDLESFADLCDKHNFNLVVDEAHALGVFAEKGKGLVHQLGLQNKVFAVIMAYGKALGCHGAAVLCTNHLYTYLINFARSLIYTTALPPHTLASISAGYYFLEKLPETNIQLKLLENIKHFNVEVARLGLLNIFTPSNSAIHCCIISGNENVKAVSVILKGYNFEVKPILSPTVPKGKERLRICLHSKNTKKDITKILKVVLNTIP